MLKFIVLAHPRSGSTLLATSLAQHPKVRMYNEILSNTEDEASRRRSYSIDGRWLGDHDDGADFLRHFFQPRNGESAAGFKLMDHHASSGPHSSAWDFLRADRELRVIAMHRADWLATLVSNEVALRSGVWNVSSEEKLPDEVAPFSVTVERCQQTFSSLADAATRTRELFAQHQHLEVEYEQLTRDYDATMDRVFSFLGVESVPTVKRLSKLARLPPRQMLSNFDELANAFAGTRWARYFMVE